MSGVSGQSTECRRVILIGIGGSSASGKSTLAKSLAKDLNSPLNVFSADHYLDIKRVRRAGSWETPAGIAWDDMRAALENLVSTLSEAERLPSSLVVGGFSRGPLELVPHVQRNKVLGPEPVVVIIEGFLLFHDKQLCDMLDLAFWLDSDCAMCARRRYDREGQRGTYADYAENFHKEVWHHYNLYRGEQLANVPQVHRLDAALEPYNLVKQAVERCQVVFKPDTQMAEVAPQGETGTSLAEVAVQVRRPVILVGIGGSSASGKSTLAKSLAKDLNSPLNVFSADHYLDIKRVRRAGSWETPAGIAWDDMRAALENVVGTLSEAERLPSSLVVGGFSRGPLELVPHVQRNKVLGPEPVVVIIEGFLLFHDKQLCDMLDVALWLHSDCEMCARRRYNREGKPGEFEEYINNFHEEVWHHYELYCSEQLANVPKVHCLNGALEPQNLAAQAAAHCKLASESGSQEVESISKQAVATPMTSGGIAKSLPADKSPQDPSPFDKLNVPHRLMLSVCCTIVRIFSGLARTIPSSWPLFKQRSNHEAQLLNETSKCCNV